jgi:hypothetical protein
MPASKSLLQRLARYRQIKISVKGRKSGRTTSRPVWFVLDDSKLYLLPVQGSDTQWYRNIRQDPWLRIDARGVRGDFRATGIKAPERVKKIIEKFREKYTPAYVRKYYSKFDVGVLINLS